MRRGSTAQAELPLYHFRAEYRLLFASDLFCLSSGSRAAVSSGSTALGGTTAMSFSTTADSGFSSILSGSTAGGSVSTAPAVLPPP